MSPSQLVQGRHADEYEEGPRRQDLPVAWFPGWRRILSRYARRGRHYGFIIDGFPRNRRQAEFFLESCDIDGVIVLDLPDSEVRRRVLNRRLCGNCGMDYNLIANSPAVPGQCDVCGGGELVTREDDTEEALAVRLGEYHQ